MGAGPLKHSQDWLVGNVDELLHAASDSVAILTTGSGEAASTLKIGRDVQPMDKIRGCAVLTMRPPMTAASSRELAFRLLHIRRLGAGIRRRFTPGRKVGGLVEKACGDVGIRRRLRKFEKGCGLLG
jgi:hypothetical protein